MGSAPFDCSDLADAAGDGFEHGVVVRLQDVDAAGVVFFPRILELFNDALFAFAAARGCSLVRMMTEDGVILPVRRCEAEFKRPLRLGERVAVAPVLAHVDGSKLLLGFRLTHAGEDGRPGEVAAVGTTRHVCVDAATFSRAALPEDLVAALAGLRAPD